MSKPTVGLTGGIASGKTTVAGLFAKLGVPVVDADAVAREIVEPGTEGWREVVSAFGSSIVAPDGSLDRKRLGAIAFSDATARARLNAITHPRIAERSTEKMSALQRGDAPYVLYEAALLIETGLQAGLDALIVVAADPEVQLERLMRRDGCTREEARARIDAQLPLAEKVRVADYVIRNDETLAETQKRVAEVHRALVQSFGHRGNE